VLSGALGLALCKQQPETTVRVENRSEQIHTMALDGGRHDRVHGLVVLQIHLLGSLGCRRSTLALAVTTLEDLGLAADGGAH
jgi:hypothetical protein